MIDTLLNIPYKIVEEDVEIDYGSFVIHRSISMQKWQYIPFASELKRKARFSSAPGFPGVLDIA